MVLIRKWKNSQHRGANAPQARSDEVEKVAFWEEMDQQLSKISAEEIIIGGDMNGHARRTKVGIESGHGGWGVGDRNDKEERVVDCADSFDFGLVNVWFEKKEENQCIIYKSRAKENQIDFLMYRRLHLREVRNCKILNGVYGSTAPGGGNGLGNNEHRKRGSARMVESQQYGDRVGGEALGKRSGKKPPDNKETWWQNDEVKETVKAKRCKTDLG
ncbi:uncharacterized protein LOC135197700 [Macrobrachium nipponense]|uniref:uncharacterized protein LOC135197700 n=1 Tax=Macrobrachium nipponense TaxID=159736 RepID=UPI0030C89126